jgi:DnaJ-class molecular chaperone
MKTCPVCGGDGTVPRKEDEYTVAETLVVCEVCDGSGFVADDYEED